MYTCWRLTPCFSDSVQVSRSSGVWLGCLLAFTSATLSLGRYLCSMVASFCTSTFVYVREAHSPPYFVYDGLEPRLIVLSIREVFFYSCLGHICCTILVLRGLMQFCGTYCRSNFDVELFHWVMKFMSLYVGATLCCLLLPYSSCRYSSFTT